jgi:hypothetical protein
MINKACPGTILEKAINKNEKMNIYQQKVTFLNSYNFQTTIYFS